MTSYQMPDDILPDESQSIEHVIQSQVTNEPKIEDEMDIEENNAKVTNAIEPKMEDEMNIEENNAKVTNAIEPTIEDEMNIEENNAKVTNVIEPKIEDEMDIEENNIKVANKDEITVQTEMEVIEEEDQVQQNNEMNMAIEEIQPSPVHPSNSKPGNANEGNSMPLDKFKRRLIRAIARHIQQKNPEEQMWQELKKEIGCDCTMLWQHMRALTLKKLKRLLPANDLLENLKKVARFTATDWLLFDLILVHEKVNVISISDGTNGDDDKRQEPQCLHDLLELVKEHNVEVLNGDDLTEAWIRVTLQYNSRGSQCSPMLLQLRWYQLKQLSRARFYNFWCQYRGNRKMLDRAMQVKPTELQTAIAKEFKHVITERYPEWEELIEQRRVILSEEFALNRELKRKASKVREENDVEIEVIEPHVETIELEIDSNEESDDNGEESCKAKSDCMIQYNNKKSLLNTDENKINLTNAPKHVTNVKSDSDDDALEIDGLSDVETMYIPLKDSGDNNSSGNFIENYSEDICNTNDNEMLPKITNVIGNVVETNEVDEHETNAIKGNNVMEEVAKTMSGVHSCIETGGTSAIECDLDDEMDNEVIHIKSENDHTTDSSIKEIDTNSNTDFPEEEVISTDNFSCSKVQSIQCDSDDEIDKILEEKASKMSIENPEIKEELIEEYFDEHINITETKIGNENTNKLLNNRDVDEENEIVNEEEKHDDGFDEVEFDDDQIEFVDDGIEFVEEISGCQDKITETKKEALNESEGGGEKQNTDYPKFDLKLLMNPTVYTKKLDKMDIFKFKEFEFVNDEQVIECALRESKPIDKLALTTEDINKFREQALQGCEINDIQNDSEIPEAPMENINCEVKCTSWLLQKPKNRSYNPIKLCKNPDFNTRLKKLTTAFLSLTRNRELLQECKPMTIDLHKAFENKLINGTMYLKSGDFKSAYCATVESVSEETITVLPSSIPGQNILTTPITSNSSIITSNKLENPEDNITYSAIVEKCIPSERRKVINLPDIDQVRRVNQSLLTAEVTPMRIHNTDTNVNSGEETSKASIVQQPFVQPILFTPIIQVKTEPSESLLEDKKNLHRESNNIDYSKPTASDLMAHKINDQIINLSNQISEVDNNGLPNNNVQNTPQQPIIKNKIGRKPKQNNVDKAKVAQQIKLTYSPMCKDQLTWTPKFSKNYVADSLLTLDTLSKILFLLKGNEELVKLNSRKKKKIIMNDTKQNAQQNTQIKKTIKEQQSNEGQRIKIKSVMPSFESCTNRGRFKNSRRGRPRAKELSSPTRKYYGIYCCWAREKIICMSINKQFNYSKHTCPKYQCHCCCRNELVTMASIKRTNCNAPSSKKPSKVFSTIVLSDDEDMRNKDTDNEKEMVSKPDSPFEGTKETCQLKSGPSISNVLTVRSDKVNVEVLIPSLIPIDKATVSTDTDIIHNVDVQSDVCKEKVSLNFNTLPSSEEYERFKKQKNCKTNVRAAEGHGHYNKHTDAINAIVKEQNTPISFNLCNIEQMNAKDSLISQTGRTLFLNSSQFVNKPARTPIYLGKNKILLCSLKNVNLTKTKVEPVLPVLPCGVKFIMLPSGKLTLSIDNGTQLDSAQLCALPTLMTIVQDKILRTNIITDTPVVVDDPNVTNNSFEKVNITKKTDETSAQTDTLSTTDKEVLSDGNQHEKKLNKDELLNLNNVNEKNVEKNNLQTIVNTEPECEKFTSSNENKNLKEKNNQPNSINTESECNELTLNNEIGQLNINNNQPEVVNTETDCAEKTLNKENKKCIENNNQQEMVNQSTETQIKESTEPHVENGAVNSQITNNVSLIEPPVQKNGDTNNICETENTNPRKTILSDLMEMSGISAEDTVMVPDVANSCTTVTPLPSTVIPITETSGSGIVLPNLANDSNVPDNISVAGAYSNLHSFEPTTATNRLLNYIAQISPELNAVTSFVELKYVYENGGKFYKLDVGTGTISEIKVLIKQNSKVLSSSEPKSFIDLTDDTSDNENGQICAEYLDIPQDKQQSSEVKPIKLFKAFRPTILKRNLSSILKENRVIYPKKAILINKQKRKQFLNIRNKYVLLNAFDKNNFNNTEEPSSSNLDSSYDTSDEEPLAKKCKRTKAIDENVTETPVLVDPPEELTSEANEALDGAQIPDMSGDMSDPEMNSMDIEGVNPELHPVAFEEGSESDEDICILGV